MIPCVQLRTNYVRIRTEMNETLSSVTASLYNAIFCGKLKSMDQENGLHYPLIRLIRSIDLEKLNVLTLFQFIMGKKKKAVTNRMVIILILCLLLSPFAGTAGQDASEPDRIKTLGSLKKLDDFPLYTMSFYGDYELPVYASPRYADWKSALQFSFVGLHLFFRAGRERQSASGKKFRLGKPSGPSPFYGSSGQVCIRIHGGYLLSRIFQER